MFGYSRSINFSNTEYPMLLFLKPEMIATLSSVCEITNVEELADGDVEEIFDDLSVLGVYTIPFF